ncbi:MAG: hypothetical protein R2781_07065 [Flavobacteriaceae bacterium]
MMLNVPHSDYGILGYVMMYFPAILVFITLFIAYIIIDVSITYFYKMELKKQTIAYAASGFILTMVVIFTFSLGTFTETVYIAIPSLIVAVLFVLKLKKRSPRKAFSNSWLGFLLLLGLITIICF